LVLVLTVPAAAVDDAAASVDLTASPTIIVHPSSPYARVKRVQVDRIYRRVPRFWPDGHEAFPVNAPAGSAIREAFSRRILHASAESLVTFWNRLYFHGVLPPAVLKSSEAVRAYVATTPGAIGYIPRDMVDDTVKVLEIDDED